MSYRRVNYQDRLLIETNLKKGLTQKEIADKLGFHKSTISREIRRNKGKKGYRFKQATQKAKERQFSKNGPYKMNPVLITQIIERLEAKWSPEQISNRLKIEGESSVSTETVYKFIHEDQNRGGELWKHLRRSRRLRKKRFFSMDRRGQIKEARPFFKRPSGSKERKNLGHWERDLMVGKAHKESVLVFTDRKSRFNRFCKLKRKSSKLVTRKTLLTLRDLPKRSIINDRGQEFSDHKNLEEKIGIKIFFCDPYSSYQRGTNENRIGVLRQYLPKGSSLKTLTNKQLERIELEINNRPMKCLDWLTPSEVMIEKKQSCTS